MACAAGNFSSAGASACTRCPPGEFQAAEGQGSCTPASLGHSVEASGSIFLAIVCRNYTFEKDEGDPVGHHLALAPLFEVPTPPPPAAASATFRPRRGDMASLASLFPRRTAVLFGVPGLGVPSDCARLARRTAARCDALAAAVISAHRSGGPAAPRRIVRGLDALAPALQQRLVLEEGPALALPVPRDHLPRSTWQHMF